MFLELPKETQQIDRLIMAFSFAYYKAQKNYSKKKELSAPGLMQTRCILLHFPY